MLVTLQTGSQCPARAVRTSAGPTRGAAVRWLRVPVVLAVAALLATGTAGCSQQPHLSGACGIVVDGSQSGNAVTGFNAQSQLKAHLYSFLNSAGCRYVVFGPINGASQASVCSQPELDMDPSIQGNVNAQAVIQAGFAAAMRRAGKELQCAQSDPRSISGASDIIGGLVRIARDRPPGVTPYNVLVVSDFVNWDSDLRLTKKILGTAASRAALIGQLAGDGLIPNLRGVHVFTAGFGVLVSKDPAFFTDFSAFWQQFMTRAHAASFQPDQS